jgi:hypothetical protein
MTGRESVYVRDALDASGAEQGVFAARSIGVGEFIARFEGVESATRTRMSLQFGPGQHIEPAEECPLRFLNHACEPNAAFQGVDLHARRDIPEGGEITIDYNAHEETLSHPFACRCGSPRCVGTVRGFGRKESASGGPVS